MIENLNLAAKFLITIGFDIIMLWCVIGTIVLPVLMIRAWWRDTHHAD